MLSVSLSTPTSHHGVLLFAMILVLLFLVIEARRWPLLMVVGAVFSLVDQKPSIRQLYEPLGWSARRVRRDCPMGLRRESAFRQLR
jgi:hypothetical protein